MAIPSRYIAEIPPGFDGFPVLYLGAIFGTMMVVLLALEWSWRIVWRFFERPCPIKHPISASRTLLLLVLTSILMRTCPNLAWMVLWKDVSPTTRWNMLQWDALFDTLSWLPFSLAWLIGYLGGAMIDYQLARHPVPLHLWPTLEQLKRPFKIGVAVFIIAAAVVFLR